MTIALDPGEAPFAPDTDQVPYLHANDGHWRCKQCGKIWRREPEHLCEGFDFRFTDLQPTIAHIRTLAPGDDTARRHLYRIFELSKPTLDSAEDQDRSFINWPHGCSKVSRAQNIRIDGDILSFELERHPDRWVVVQKWTLDLVSLAVKLVDDGWRKPDPHF